MTPQLEKILSDMMAKTEVGSGLGLTCVDAMVIQRLIAALKLAIKQRDSASACYYQEMYGDPDKWKKYMKEDAEQENRSIVSILQGDVEYLKSIEASE